MKVQSFFYENPPTSVALGNWILDIFEAELNGFGTWRAIYLKTPQEDWIICPKRIAHISRCLFILSDNIEFDVFQKFLIYSIRLKGCCKLGDIRI